MPHNSTYFDPEKRYIARTLGEIEEQISSMLGTAPTFIDDYFDFQNIDTEFEDLARGFDNVRSKLGEERYAELVGLASQAKALFAADPEGRSGEADLGLKLLLQIDDILHATRTERVKRRLTDEEGGVTGD
jgi:hypothetical protein